MKMGSKVKAPNDLLPGPLVYRGCGGGVEGGQYWPFPWFASVKRKVVVGTNIGPKQHESLMLNNYIFVFCRRIIYLNCYHQGI